MGILLDSKISEINKYFLENDQEELITSLKSLKSQLIDFYSNQPVDIVVPLMIKDRDQEVQRKFDLAVQQSKKKNFESAISSLQEALNLNPTNLRLREWIGYFYLKKKDLSISFGIFNNLNYSPYSSKNWNLSYIHFQQGDLEEAYKNLQNELMASSNPSQRLIKNLLSLSISLKKTEEIINLLSKLNEIEAYALGTIIAFEEDKNWLSFQERLLEATQQYSRRIVFPDPAENMSIEETEKLFKETCDHNCIELGINYFSARRNKKNGPIWLVNKCLGDLHNIKGLPREAIRFYIAELNTTLSNQRLHDHTKQRRLFELLEYCQTYNFTEESKNILKRARKFGLTNEKILGFEALLDDDYFSNNRDNDAKDTIINSNGHLNRITSMSETIAQRLLIEEYCNASVSLYGENISPIKQIVMKILDLLHSYISISEYQEKIDVAKKLMIEQGNFETKFSEQEVGVQDFLSPLRKVMRTSISEVHSHTDVLPQLIVEILNSFLTHSSRESTLVLKISNQSDVDIISAEIQVISIDGGIKLTKENKIQLPNGLKRGATKIVNFPYKRTDSRFPQATIAIQTTLSTSIIQKIIPNQPTNFSLPVKSFKKVIGKQLVENRYITVGAIPSSRPENFQGRKDILDRISASISDGELQEALFINGLRRVGKTSVFVHLEGNPPPGILPILIRIDLMNPKTTGEFVLGIVSAIEQRIKDFYPEYETNFDLDSLDALTNFNSNPAFYFKNYISKFSKILRNDKLLIMFDEFQVLTEEIQKTRLSRNPHKLDIDAFDIIRGHIEMRTFLAIFTGSLLFSEIREQVRNYDRLWGSVKSVDISFLDDEAVENVLIMPSTNEKVSFTEQAIQRVIEFTKGYPVFVQLIGSELINLLNNEERLVVSPGDIDFVADKVILEQSHLFEFWWDEKRLDKKVDHLIVETILENQISLGIGIGDSRLKSLVCNKEVNESQVTKRINELVDLHVLERLPDDVNSIRIKALMLEKWLGNRVKQATTPQAGVVSIFVDYENIHGVFKNLEKLAYTLLEKAENYGTVKRNTSYVVADWTGKNMGNERDIFRRANWLVEYPLRSTKKKEISDHALREVIHEVVDDNKNITCCILVVSDGDYDRLITYLKERNINVVVWAVRGKASPIYVEWQKYNRIEFHYLEDLVDNNS